MPESEGDSTDYAHGGARDASKAAEPEEDAGLVKQERVCTEHWYLQSPINSQGITDNMHSTRTLLCLQCFQPATAHIRILTVLLVFWHSDALMAARRGLTEYSAPTAVETAKTLSIKPASKQTGCVLCVISHQRARKHTVAQTMHSSVNNDAGL
jgi:hypothetical protein